MPTSNKNRLFETTSPYLLQHAENPVAWWPWCPEALQLAREEDRPILLSVGYSACHWCHVMAHESFEDPTTAALMNELFVNIKVDREERPDLDKIYQTAYQLLTRRAGGWPLTVFLTPGDHAPFFAGTYFPPKPRHGMISFPELLNRIHTAYVEQRNAIHDQNQALLNALGRLEPQSSGDSILSETVLVQADQQFTGSFDATYGGFGAAPKFPHPSSLRYLLLRWQQNGDDATRHMLMFTLRKMAEGGMHDLLGGGFCRYSVDQEWMIPHFEKMLYDNGPLLALYADAWRADDQRPLFKHACGRTADWLVREMQSESGGYYSSLDADSEGAEGRFYVWDKNEVRQCLSKDEYEVFAARFGLDAAPNFEDRWHLHTYTDTKTLQEKYNLDAKTVRKLLRAARDKLFEVREQRVRPGRDEKVLTSWNALMIFGMARAGRLFDERDWLTSAQRATDFLRNNHWRGGRLLATSKDGHAHLPAYLDDYAYLIDALLELLQARWRRDDLHWAIELADCLLAHFEDKADGGFYFTANDHEQLILRPKTPTDDATPSGYGVAISALLKLGHLIGDTRYLAAAERALHAVAQAVKQAPHAHATLLCALIDYLQPPEVLVIRADRTDRSAWLTAANQHWQLSRNTYFIPTDANELPGLLQERKPHADGVAYRCLGTHCDAPISTPDELDRVLGGNE